MSGKYEELCHRLLGQNFGYVMNIAELIDERDELKRILWEAPVWFRSSGYDRRSWYRCPACEGESPVIGPEESIAETDITEHDIEHEPDCPMKDYEPPEDEDA